MKLFARNSSAFAPIYRVVTLVNLVEVIFAFTIPLLAYKLSSSATGMGIIRAAEFLPHLLLSVGIGLLVDRADKGRLIRACLLLAVPVALLSSLALRFAYQSLLLQALAVFAISTLVLIVRVSMNVVAKENLAKEELLVANAKIQSTAEILHTVGPLIAGVVLYFSYPEAGLMGCALCFVVALVLTRQLTIARPQAQDAGGPGVLQQLKEGFATLRGIPALMHFSLLVMVINAFVASANIVNIFVVKDYLNLPDYALGISISIAAVGAALGGVVLARVEKSLTEMQVIGICMVLLTVGYLITYLFRSYWAVTASMFLEGFATLCVAVTVWTYRQRVVGVKMLGRVSGITGMIFKVLTPVGLVLSTVYVDAYELFGFYIFAGSLSMATAFAVFALSSRKPAIAD